MDFNHLTSAALSDIGRKRKANEDAILILPKAGVFCVADGMGGAAGGELASRWTVEAVRSAFPTGVESAQKTAQIRQALNAASRRIKAMADERAIVGAGTTAVVLFFDDYQPEQAAIVHAGDSRAYRLRDGFLECLTEDHSLAAAAGLAHDGALPSMFRGVITRAIGLDDTVELDEIVVQVKAGDCYLLCSDGLTKMLADNEIRALITAVPLPDPARIATALVEEANRAGGDDNVSVIVVCVGELPTRQDRPDISQIGGPADITETAEIAVPAEGAGNGAPPAAPPDTGSSSDFSRSPDTEDSVVGVTPESGHGTTLTLPAAAAGGKPRRPPTRARLGGRIPFILLLLAALAAAYAVNRQYRKRTPPVPPQPPAAVLPLPAAPDTGGHPAGTEPEAAWQAERNRALQDSAYPAAALAQYRDVMATLSATLKLPAPADLPAGPEAPTAEQRAEEYCVQLADLQRRLLAQIAAFADDRTAELNLFGDSPASVLDVLRRISGQPPRPGTDPQHDFESLRRSLGLVAGWLDEDPRRLIPLEEIRGGPPSLLPGLLARRNALWEAVLADIEACGPAFDQLRQADPGDPRLNNLAALQRVIMKSAEAGRARPDVIPWPGRENLPTLAGFFHRARQYLDGAPAPESAPPAGE